MSALVRQLGWRLILVPSVVFATTVFVCGVFPVSPFATWPLGLIVVLTLPGVAGFVAVVLRMNRSRRQRSTEVPLREFFPGWRWTTLKVVGIIVALSFFGNVFTSNGQPDIVDGEYVASDHGEVLAKIDRHQWLKLRTDDTRVFSGHLMWFGLLGLLAVEGAANEMETRKRISGRVTDCP